MKQHIIHVLMLIGCDLGKKEYRKNKDETEVASQFKL